MSIARTTVTAAHITATVMEMVRITIITTATTITHGIDHAAYAVLPLSAWRS
jgi:hypothetical protein